MAFSSAEKNKIVQLLGYGSKILQAGSVIYNKILNDRLDTVPADGEALVRTYLAQVTAIENQLNQSIARYAAAEVGDVRMNARESEMLRAERKKVAREIAAHVDIPYRGMNSMNVGVSV